VLYGSGIGFIVMLAPLGIVFFMGAKIATMKTSTAQTLFWVFSILMGASLSYIFIAYTSTSIVRVFFITAGTFGAMSLYGYTTRRSLAGWGSFLMMGLIGIIIAMVVNIFLQSEMMHFVISVIGVLVFTGLTAYDTQRIKEAYAESDGQDVLVKKSIMGALSLYLNFINLFMMLLHLFGGARE
jgi:FtsH-binding integral membrane protein